MSTNQHSSTQIEILEKEMINDIVHGYFECKDFFSKNVDHKNTRQQNQKRELLRKLSRNFYQKYESHPSILTSVHTREVLEKSDRVFIQVVGGSFMFPISFVNYMDRLKDVNLTPIREINLSELDKFMRKFSILTNLDDFLTGFFHTIKSIVIPLRERDIEMLHTLSNPQLLQKTNKGKNRIHPPEFDELVEILGYSKKQYFRIVRSYNFLYKTRVCYPTTLIMNPSRFGYYFAQFEYGIEHSEHIEKIKPFLFWDFPIKDRKIAIACVPFGNVNELLNPFDFTQLTNWYWNINTQHYSFNKNNPDQGWKDMILPDFLSKSFRTSNYINWDLISAYKDEFSESEIDIIKNLTKMNAISLDTLDRLSDKLSSGGIRHILDQLIEKEVYQLYPGINHIDLKDVIVYKIICKNKEFYQSTLHSLLSLPISHLMTNENENLITGYFHVPKAFISKIVDNLQLLKLLLKEEISIEYEVMPEKRKITKYLNLSNIDFEVKHGAAYLLNN